MTGPLRAQWEARYPVMRSRREIVMRTLRNPSTFSREEIERTADQKFLKYGDDAFAEAAKEISALNGRGDFSAAESWVMVCHRIRKLQALNTYEGAPQSS